MNIKTDLKEFDNLNIKNIINKIQQNAWENKEIKSIILIASNNKIKISSVKIKDEKNCICLDLSIEENNKVLYNKFSIYENKYEVKSYVIGKFKKINNIIKYIENKLKGKEVLLTKNIGKTFEI